MIIIIFNQRPLNPQKKKNRFFGVESLSLSDRRGERLLEIKFQEKVLTKGKVQGLLVFIEKRLCLYKTIWRIIWIIIFVIGLYYPKKNKNGVISKSQSIFFFFVKKMTPKKKMKKNGKKSKILPS